MVGYIGTAMRRLLTLFSALVAITAQPVRAEDVLVAVAANFAPALEAVRPGFEAATGDRIRATTGSTGKLYAQIAAGAPFAVLLSADAATPERLEAEGLAVPDTRFTYAFGRLVLWSADAGRIGSDPEAAIADPGLRHLAIANPELAPYGEAAREALQSLGMWDDLAGRVVMGENVGQTQALVAAGAAEIGFVALSGVIGLEGEDAGSHWIVPEYLYEPIRQDAVLLGPGADSAAAKALLDYLAGPDAQAVVARFGYPVD